MVRNLMCVENVERVADSQYRGFSQAFYRQKLYETVLGYSGLEDFMQNFWEKWACSKGMPLQSSLIRITGLLIHDSRPREPARYDPDLAEWRCFQARPI